jgi:hypothetical protein
LTCVTAIIDVGSFGETQQPPHGDGVTALIRPVDALERLFYRYSERNPDHFLSVAEFGEELAADRCGHSVPSTYLKSVASVVAAIVEKT